MVIIQYFLGIIDLFLIDENIGAVIFGVMANLVKGITFWDNAVGKIFPARREEVVLIQHQDGSRGKIDLVFDMLVVENLILQREMV